MPARFAIYFVPRPNSALARFGVGILGRDIETGDEVEALQLEGISPEVQRCATAHPRRYGFHATLKPPFGLTEGCCLAGLESTLAEFAHDTESVMLPGLKLGELDGFLALRPIEDAAQLSLLAAACVERFDNFRAPPDPAELEERRGAGLNAAQARLLEQWGYPWVFEEFRFHMTLTERLDPASRALWRRAIDPLVASACASPIFIDELALVEQEDRRSPFTVRRRFSLRR